MGICVRVVSYVGGYFNKCSSILFSKVVTATLALTLSVSVNATSITGGSDLLTTDFASQLESWLGQGSINLTNVYDKVAGDTSSDFHAAADNMGPTFSVIEIINGADKMIIGGYNPTSWNGSLFNYSTTGNLDAFLFNLTTSTRYVEGGGVGPIELYQTYNSTGYGPTFGGGHDLYINGTLSGGYANIGHTYGDGTQYGNTSYRNAFAGSYNSWSVGQMEVFTISLNTPPDIAGISTEQPVSDTATIEPFSAVLISDADGNNVSVTITLDIAAKGIFTTSSLSAAGFSDEGNGSYTLASSTTADAQTAIRLLVYAPTNDRVAPGLTETTTFTVEVNDGSSTSSDSVTTVISTSINDAPSFNATPSISGTALVGNTLNAANIGTTDLDVGDVVALSYEWKANDIVIPLATASSYQLTASEAHKTITLEVTGTDDYSGVITVTTAGVSVANSAPGNAVLPAVSGTAAVGNSLNTSDGSWMDIDGDSLSYSYQWYRADDNSGSNEMLIALATNSSYTLTTDDAHKYLKVIVTADDGNGSTDQTAISGRTSIANTAPLNSALPVISGTATVGNALSTTPGSWTDADGDTPTYSYQWKADEVNIGTNANNYTLTSSEAHKSITVVVTADDGNGGVFDAISAGTAVSNTAPENTVLPAISGNVVVGATLMTTTGTWTDADGDTPGYSYQWKASGSPVGSNNSSYDLTSSEFGKLITVEVTAVDGHGGNVTATSNATVAVDTDLDGDGTGDATDSDIDGDGIDNTWETANGLDPLDNSDATTDLDGDGVNNLDEFLASSDPTTDDNPPVVTPPADITVDASGLFTAVTVGTATAVDVLDGSVSTNSDAPSHFAPGVNTVIWSATDAAGNTGTATQTVSVNPMVNLSVDQATAEGGTVFISVVLNGNAANYPVTVPYTVSGTAAIDGSDHNLTDGIITISSGTSVLMSVTTVDDGAGEGLENMVVTLGSPTNAVIGTKSTHSIDIIEGNVSPMVNLVADQGMGSTLIVTADGGSVTVMSSVTDPNSTDSHSYDWSATDNALIDTDGVVDETFTIDPSTLTEGLYTLRLTVSDGNGGSDTVELSLNLLATAPVLTTADSDGDGINDVTEGYGDSDSDGIPDYLDAIAASNVLQEQSGQSNRDLLETEPGLNLSIGQFAFQTGSDQAQVSMADVSDLSGISDDTTSHDYPADPFDVSISGLPIDGESINVVVAQQAAIPANGVYRILMPGGWQTFVVDANNVIASAPGTNGYCPPPADAAYTTGLTEGDWCVQLTIEDGGSNDADGAADTVITITGGVAASNTTDSGGAAASNITYSGGGGCTIGDGTNPDHTLLLLLLLSLLYVFRNCYHRQKRY